MGNTTERPPLTNNLQPSGENDGLAYRSRRRLLSDGELRFYRQGLRPAVGDRYAIAPKVRLTDVLAVPAGQWESPAGRKISQRHVDFVLCTRRAWSIVAVVELDDASHLDAAQQKKDAYLGDALHTAGIPLVRFPVYRRYDPTRIARRIGHAVNAMRAPR